MQIEAQSTEDDQPYTNAYMPSSINFQDIYTNVLGKQADSSISEETDAPINNVPPEFSEFNPKNAEITTSPTTSNSSLNISNSTIVHIPNEDTTTPFTRNVEEDLDEPIEVIPIRQSERGILDILLPPNRVKMFKNMFDSFRRILSYTF